MKRFLLIFVLSIFLNIGCSNETESTSSLDNIKTSLLKKESNKTSISGLSVNDFPNQLIAGKTYNVTYSYYASPCDTFGSLIKEENKSGMILHGALLDSDWDVCITSIEYRFESFYFQPTQVGEFNLKVLTHFEDGKPYYETKKTTVVAL